MALRFLYDNISISGIDTSVLSISTTEITKRVTNYFHSSHGLSYDTLRGASHYLNIISNVEAEFLLYDYIKKQEGVTVNCYDQASSVNVFAGILGASGEKMFIMPFGYIKPTVLVGGLSCNNPFYQSTESSPIVDRLSPLRTSFGNHQIYRDVSNMIFDACAGPHLGTENYLTYMGNSVDVSVQLSSPPEYNPSGIISWVIIPNIFKINSLA